MAVLGVWGRFLGELWIFPSNQKNVARRWSAVWVRYRSGLMEKRVPVGNGLVEGRMRVGCFQVKPIRELCANS